MVSIIKLLKLMKKYILITALAMLVSESAFARTQGLLVGLDYLATTTGFIEKTEYIDNREPFVGKKHSRTTNGVGLNVKYAFNANNFFIAPGAFVEQNSFGTESVNDPEYSRKKLQTKNRFGARVDVGYDFNLPYYFPNNQYMAVSPYLTGGYAVVHYKSASELEVTGLGTFTDTRKGFDGNFFYGAGLKIDIAQNLALNFEYNRQDYLAKVNIASSPVELRQQYSADRFKTTLDIYKIGLIYNF